MLTKQWVQPVLTSYTDFGTLSVSSVGTNYYGWHTSDGVHNVQANTWEALTGSVPGWLKWELPYPIRISAITLYNKYTGNTRLTKDVNVYADEEKTKFIGSGTFPAGVAFGRVDIEAVNQFDSSVIFIDLATTYNLQVGLAEMVITATVAGELTLTALPIKLVYYAGEPLDITGLEVSVIYADDTSEVVTDYTVSGYDPNTVGTQDVFVTYMGEEVSFSVTVLGGTPMTSDAMYNSTDRVIQQKFVIYFDGTPLTVTKDNYLISSSILEETQSDIKSYLGSVTSNELDLSLFNDRRIFTPTNIESPYYGKIVKNLQIDAFMRAYDGVEREWVTMGKFYVTSWVAAADGLVVSITANDAMYRVLQSPQPSMPITPSITHKSLFEAYFGTFNVPTVVDEDLIEQLTYAYISGSPKDFLTELSSGAMADCFCDRLGNARIKYRAAARDVRATITDNDQILSASIAQSIETGYDGSQVTCNAKQESVPTKVLSIKNTELASGITEFDNVALTTSLLVRLNHIAISGLSPVEVRNIAATPSYISFDVYNGNENATLSDITVYGNTLETVSTVMEDAGDELLKLNSGYVQTIAYANRVKAFVDKIVANKIPTLTINARGNPLLQLGDLVHINSNQYKLDYDGILIRATYDYDGGLHATYIFAAAQAFLEVS